MCPHKNTTCFILLPNNYAGTHTVISNSRNLLVRLHLIFTRNILVAEVTAASVVTDPE